jgi:flagellar biosynthetic protein FlhB
VTYILGHMEHFSALASYALPTAVSQLSTLVLSAFALMTITLAAIAAIDVPYQVISFRNRLKMTVQEVKEEEREAQGDPRLKARVRKAQREMARRRMMAAVPKADVVVTNPTHFAIAIKYLEDRHRAPVVVAKGMDAVATRIREIAREAGVPQLEAPPLARALYEHVEIGAEIPAALYTAVAQVLAYIFQLKRHAQGQAPRPVEPTDIEVPEGMDPLAPRARA